MRRTILSFTCLLLLSLILTGCVSPPLESSTPTVEVTLPIETSSPSPTSTPEPIVDLPTPSPKVFKLGNADPYAIKYAKIIEFYWNLLHWDDDSEAYVRMEEAYWHDEKYDELSDEERDVYKIWHTCRWMQGISNSYGDADRYGSDGYVGYAIHDVNGDGIPELFIIYSGYYNKDDFSESRYIFSVQAVYTLCDDVPVLVDAYTSRYCGAIDATGTFYIWSHSGASFIYVASYYLVPGSAELRLIEEVGVTGRDEETDEMLEKPQYYRIVNGSKTIIDREECEALWDSMPDPFSDRITRYAGLVVIPLI